MIFISSTAKFRRSRCYPMLLMTANWSNLKASGASVDWLHYNCAKYDVLRPRASMQTGHSAQHYRFIQVQIVNTALGSKCGQRHVASRGTGGSARLIVLLLWFTHLHTNPSRIYSRACAAARSGSTWQLSWVQAASLRPMWSDMTSVDTITLWREHWSAASVLNLTIVTDPTIRQPGFHLPHPHLLMALKWPIIC